MIYCPECNSQMILRDSKYGLFYGCSSFPKCRATHGAHPDGKPLGTPANRETKQARIAAHDLFDRLWKDPEPLMSRGEAYVWMQRTLGLSPEEAHIGRFDMEDCGKLAAAVVEFIPTIPDKAWPFSDRQNHPKGWSGPCACLGCVQMGVAYE